jgi:hypothetical protein
MPSDREQEIHFQPPECGNCGGSFVWSEDAGKWVPNCRCNELDGFDSHDGGC